MVEWPLAERSLCHVHGNARGGRLETRMAALGQFHGVACGGDASRWLEEHASHRVPGGKTRRSSGYVRRADLRKRRLRVDHARPVSRRIKKSAPQPALRA